MASKEQVCRKCGLVTPTPPHEKLMRVGDELAAFVSDYLSAKTEQHRRYALGEMKDFAEAWEEERARLKSENA